MDTPLPPGATAPTGHARVLEDFEDVSELFRALSSPVRIALVTLLTDGEMCVHELVDALALPQPLVSQHLRILREADLVSRTRRGREVAYVLRDEHVAHIVADARQHSGERPAGGDADGSDAAGAHHEDAGDHAPGPTTAVPDRAVPGVTG